MIGISALQYIFSLSLFFFFVWVLVFGSGRSHVAYTLESVSGTAPVTSEADVDPTGTSYFRWFFRLLLFLRKKLGVLRYISGDLFATTTFTQIYRYL
jgi:hypothetical protein